MKKMIARTALIAVFSLAAMSLSACGNKEDCSNPNSNPVSTTSAAYTAAPAMLPAKGSKGGGSKSKSRPRSKTSGTTRGLNGTKNQGSGSTMPYWFGGSRTTKCTNTTVAPSPAPSSKQLR